MPLGKLRFAAAPPKHSLNQRSGRDSAWEGGEEGGQVRGLQEGSAPEHEGPRERRGAQAAKPVPRIHYSKHLPGVSRGVGVGTLASTLAAGSDLGSSVTGAASRPAPRRGCTWSQPRARPRAASRSCTPCCAWSAHSPRPSARPVLPGPSSPAVLCLPAVPDSVGTLSSALLERPTFGGFRGGEGETKEQRRPELRLPEPR